MVKSKFACKEMWPVSAFKKRTGANNKVERKKTRFGSVSLETSLEWFKKIPDYLLKFLLQ